MRIFEWQFNNDVLKKNCIAIFIVFILYEIAKNDKNGMFILLLIFTFSLFNSSPTSISFLFLTNILVGFLAFSVNIYKAS